MSPPIYRWGLLKTGCCVWLKFASIFLSLVFEKHCKWQRSLLRCSGAGTFVYFIAKQIARFSFRKCLDYLQSCILVFLTVTYDTTSFPGFSHKLFHHQLESSSSVRLGFSFFNSLVPNLTRVITWKDEINIQVLGVYRDIKTFFKSFFSIKRFKAAK